MSETSEPEPTVITIRDQAIRLGQLIKLAGLADDGGTARALIESGRVRVDGEVETRRGRQLTAGTRVVVTDPESGQGPAQVVVVASDFQAR